MDYYTYPLDTKTLLRKKIMIKKELLSDNVEWIIKKIAVLGGSTTNEVVDQLELALLNHGIKADFYQSEYGKYWEDVMFDNPALDDFEPDFIYIHVNWRNITSFPTLSDTDEEIENKAESEFGRFVQLWEKIYEKYHCIIIQNNFERPDHRLLGNRDIWDLHGKSNYIFGLNQQLYQYARSHSSFFINDLNYIAQSVGLIEWSDPLYWNMYKYICPINAIPHIAVSVANIIKSVLGKNKKLMALDLDNTLWGGVIGDDGIDNIQIGKETPKGQSFYTFQEYCKELKQIGVVLAVDSKNDEENAVEGLRHPDGVLKPDDFVSIKANWLPKDQNLSEIAEELDLGLDGFVFIDDNPAERELVKNNLKMVTVPEISGPEKYVVEIDRCGFFEVTNFSAEDYSRTDQYKARAMAKAVQGEYADYSDYLKSLNMRAVITGFDPLYISRIAQLTNKTNQFNLTTKRCTEEEIRYMYDSDKYVCICGRLVDRFTDNGIVTVVVGEMIESELHIRIWLMSCRVLKRGLEDAIMNEIVKRSEKIGIKTIKGYYYPTSKNNMVKGFYCDMGFELCSEDDEHNTTWKLDIMKYEYRNTQIDVEEG